MNPAEQARTPHQPFVVAHARGDHWGLAAKACLETLAGQPANVGFLYVTEAFNQNLSSILTFLRETTRIPHWVGAVVPTVIAGDEALGEGGALAVMTGLLPEDGFRAFWGLEAEEIATRLRPWLDSHGPCLGLAHGDSRSPGVAALLQALAAQVGSLTGGLVSSSGPPAQLADSVVSGGIAGLLVGAEVPVVTGLTQGCTPIGPLRRVTAGAEGVIMSLDGRPALDVLKQDAGQLIARDIRRASGYIHLAVPVAGSDSGDSDAGDYMVRMLLGVDPRQGWLAVGDRIDEGAQVMFVRRDPQSARADMERMLADVSFRLAGRPVRAAFYFSCVGRGGHMFGEDDREVAMIREALGPVPLIGFFGHGEFSGDRLYGFTGVLAVLAGERP
ncbi:MAG TPA: FIST C-terminal domain-containing protein [Magnetospirillum sp.]|nr:FIST C-terminal domain-containing protein [Magnetospirillum sp.]